MMNRIKEDGIKEVGGAIFNKSDFLIGKIVKNREKNVLPVICSIMLNDDVSTLLRLNLMTLMLENEETTLDIPQRV